MNAAEERKEILSHDLPHLLLVGYKIDYSDMKKNELRVVIIISIKTESTLVIKLIKAASIIFSH